MDKMIPWTEWVEMIRPYYPKGERGRPVRGIETMTRMYLLQMWFNLSDEGVEDAIYDSYAMRSFMRIDFMEESVPDATIISAPSSTKNATGKRDPEMHRTKKGNQWYHGMKVHIGVDAGTGIVHTVIGTAANVHDSKKAVDLIRDDDEVVYGDSGYLGIEKQDRVKEDDHLSKIDYRINKRPSSLKITDSCTGINWDKEIERRKSSVRCRVEHAFLIVKRDFGYKKTAYRGLFKNMNRFHVLFACANLLMCLRAERSLRPLEG